MRESHFDPTLPGSESLTIAYLSAGTIYSALITHSVDMAELKPSEMVEAHSDAPTLLNASVPMPGTGLEMAIKTGSGPFTTVAVGNFGDAYVQFANAVANAAVILGVKANVEKVARSSLATVSGLAASASSLLVTGRSMCPCS